jgi:hypothetical protein
MLPPFGAGTILVRAAGPLVALGAGLAAAVALPLVVLPLVAAGSAALRDEHAAPSSTKPPSSTAPNARDRR